MSDVSEPPTNSRPAPRARQHRFPRAFRVLRKSEFQRAYRDGSRARGGILIVVAIANTLGYTRLGLSVGKVIWRDAVGRNRVKRIFREAFRTVREELPAGFDLILIPAQPKLEPELEATRAELIKIARKAVERFRAKPAPPPAARETPAQPGAKVQRPRS
jgi:ribonuclease P protein component